MKPESLAFEAAELDKKLADYVKLRKNYRMFKDISSLISDPKLLILANKNKEVFKGAGRTAHRIGLLLGINPHYIYDAKAIMKAEPNLKEFIIEGKVALRDCRNILKLPAREKKEILKKIYDCRIDREGVRRFVEKHYKQGAVEKPTDFDEVVSALKKNMEQNITANQRFYLIGSAYGKLCAATGGNRRSGYSPAGNTSVRLAEAIGMSRASVERSRTFAKVIDRLKIKNPKQAEDILKGKFRGALTLLSSAPNAQSYELKKVRG